MFLVLYRVANHMAGPPPPSLSETGTYIHYITLHYITLHYIALHCIVLYCIALHCIALHCIALHCIVLYYMSVDLHVDIRVSVMDVL